MFLNPIPTEGDHVVPREHLVINTSRSFLILYQPALGVRGGRSKGNVRKKKKNKAKREYKKKWVGERTRFDS